MIECECLRKCGTPLESAAIRQIRAQSVVRLGDPTVESLAPVHEHQHPRAAEPAARAFSPLKLLVVPAVKAALVHKLVAFERLVELLLLREQITIKPFDFSDPFADVDELCCFAPLVPPLSFSAIGAELSVGRAVETRPTVRSSRP
jgi:hypothetical protein